MSDTEKIRITEKKRVWMFRVTDAKGNIIKEEEKEELLSRKVEKIDDSDNNIQRFLCNTCPFERSCERECSSEECVTFLQLACLHYM